MDYYPTLQRYRGSQESLYGSTTLYGSNLFGSSILYGSTKSNRFSPRQKSSGFFSSDDSLYKAELKKLTIPRISIEPEPSFNLEVTDFSEPEPKDSTYIIEESLLDYPKLDLLDVKNKKKGKSGPVHHLSGSNTNKISLEINDIPFIDSEFRNNDDNDEEKCDESKFENLLISQELSSSQSSINSSVGGNQELALDLTLVDTEYMPSKPRCWKSPDQVRLGYVKSITQQFEDIFSNRTVAAASSVPELRETAEEVKKKSNSEENLTNKLSETERLEVFKLLQDWSTFGSDAPKSNVSINISIHQENQIIHQNVGNVDCVDKPKLKEKYRSEPNISKMDKDDLTPNKYKSDSELSKIISETFNSHTHKCDFKNCIFNIDTLKNETEITPTDDFTEDKSMIESSEKEKLGNVHKKGILKNPVVENIFNNDVNSQNEKPFNGQLVKSDSLDNIKRCKKKYTARVYSTSSSDVRKFPESYIVTRKKKVFDSNEKIQICNCLDCRYQDAARRQRQRASLPINSFQLQLQPADKLENPVPKPTPRIVFIQRKDQLLKTWKSCNDIYVDKRRAVKKCCRYAKRTCPVLKNSCPMKRDCKSCADIYNNNMERTKSVQCPSVGFADKIGSDKCCMIIIFITFDYYLQVFSR